MSEPLSFDLWLFVIKHLAQTPDSCALIYQQLSTEEKQKLEIEYQEYRKNVV